MEDQPTVTINDPYSNIGSTTLLSRYGNQHLGVIRWLHVGNEIARANYVTLSAMCPVALLVTDQDGRRTGYDPRTGLEYDEIPGSSYVTTYSPSDVVGVSGGVKTLTIETYESSSFQLDIVGTGTGSYVIEYTAELPSGETTGNTFEGTTEDGQVDTVRLFYDPNSGFLDGVFLPVVIR